MPALVDDLPRVLAVLKAFTTYFQLVNLAEDEQRIEILRDRAREAQTTGVPMRETLAESVAKLRNEGLTAEMCNSILDELYIVPVLTAHPTETKRQTILTKLRTISDTLEHLTTPGLLPQRSTRADGATARGHCAALAERRDARPPTYCAWTRCAPASTSSRPRSST
jgi:phosphoenolpyruvate carboxylase